MSGSGTWNEGLFDCYVDPKLCCLQIFCPCLVLGYVGGAMGEDKKKSCIAYFIPLYNLYCVYKLRDSVKKQKSIEGEGSIQSWLFVICCTFCSLNQMARETESGPYGSSMARE
eukprot:TRINITY_DN46_c0_g1_i1.p1 TRINITY_DN46_c0_g1~~TRINITY_DN46_c0_g1_i1.p1  ORF type:complete len:113 (+),score=14.07 TRINITY_DN46_c0_g1_i1:85-423(+)